MQIEEIGVLAITKDGELIGVVYNDLTKRCPVFYEVKKMGFDEIKNTLQTNENISRDDN